MHSKQIRRAANDEIHQLIAYAQQFGEAGVNL